MPWRNGRFLPTGRLRAEQVFSVDDLESYLAMDEDSAFDRLLP